MQQGRRLKYEHSLCDCSIMENKTLNGEFKSEKKLNLNHEEDEDEDSMKMQ